MATKEESAPSGSFCECKNLDPAEKDQAAQHAAPAASSFTKSYARTAKRDSPGPGRGLLVRARRWMAMSFSFLAMALIQSKLPEGLRAA